MNYKDKEQKIDTLLTRIFMLSFISVINCTPSFANDQQTSQKVSDQTVASTNQNKGQQDKNNDGTKTNDEAATPANQSEYDVGPNQNSEDASQKDPYEKFNRGVFAFNDKLDKLILKPVATLYNKIMPRPLNQGVHNFFNNIGTLPTIANDLLQFNFYQATNDFWRFGINSTIGVAGFFDIATRMHLKYYSNDFGLTLAKWGYKNSNYLMLPFFGPSSLRDGIGIPVDYFAFSVYPYVKPTSARYELYGLGVVDRRAQLLKIESVMEEAAFDKYVFVRNAYVQRRTYQIDQNQHRGYKDQQAEASAERKESAVVVTETNSEFKPEVN